MHPQKIVVILLSIIGMFTIILPWATTPGKPVMDGTSGAGWITSAIYLLIMVIVLTGSFKKRISGFSFICISLLSILNSIYGIMIINNMKSTFIDAMMPSGTNTGFGLYILIIIGFLVPLFGLLLRGNGDRSSNNGSKNEIEKNVVN